MSAPYSPYRHFSKAEWEALRHGERMTLTGADVERLRALSDPIALAEAERVYLPLSRLLSMYVEATQRLFVAQKDFLHSDDPKMPFIIGV